MPIGNQNFPIKRHVSSKPARSYLARDVRSLPALLHLLSTTSSFDKHEILDNGSCQGRDEEED
jgi:hypothetical protein